MNNGNLPKDSRENEILSIEDEKLRLLLGSLKRVEAPGNFAFSVKAKIAKAQPAPSNPSVLWPVLRYAAPFALLVLLGGFVVFNLFLSPEPGDVPQVAEVTSPLKSRSTPENYQAPVQNLPEPLSPNVKSEYIAITANRIKKVKSGAGSIAGQQNEKRPTVKDVENAPGGSRDLASTSKKIILPNGLNPQQPVPTPQDLINPRRLSVSEILRQIGIEIGSNRQIVSVKPGSLADRSGIKTGDIIEAIDDQKLTTDNMLTESSSGKILHLIRAGKKISAELGKP